MKIEQYEKHAADYDDWFSKNRFAYESELRAVKRLLPKGDLGVEIGVGTGRFAGELGVPLGVEPSKSMRGMAKQRGVSVVCAKAEALPFRDDRFDYALMVTVICFFDDVRRSFREAHRVLKPSGSLVVAFIDRESPLGRKYDERKSETTYYANATFHSAVEVERCLAEAGFRSFSFCQTIFGKHGEMEEPDPVKDGHGEGCFVVVKADK
ncbi:MAG: class I SAM-dependent methyltransferase [Deltaproteobacteria bacterium]|nr:class I SAM-dependent methyltransferase [Deltaproteobacteria bacterium]